MQGPSLGSRPPYPLLVFAMPQGASAVRLGRPGRSSRAFFIAAALKAVTPGAVSLAGKRVYREGTILGSRESCEDEVRKLQTSTGRVCGRTDDPSEDRISRFLGVSESRRDSCHELMKTSSVGYFAL